MDGISNIIESLEQRISQELKVHKQKIYNEINCVKNIKAVNHRDPKRLSNSWHKQTNYHSHHFMGINVKQETDKFPEFPFRSIEALTMFNEKLVTDPEYYKEAVQHVESQLMSLKKSKSFFTRRIYLKSMLFTE